MNGRHHLGDLDVDRRIISGLR